MDLGLKNRRVLIGGSTAGIGKAAAIAFSKEGANVTLLARDQEKLNHVKAELISLEGQEHHTLLANFDNPEEVKQVVEKYVKEEKIYALVNNTGGPPAGPAHTADADAFIKAFQNHLICNQYLVQAVLSGMKEEGAGRIVNVISTSVKQPIPNLGVSNTIRGAVANWAKTLSLELAPFGITVNNVLPGATCTGRLESIIQNKAKKNGQSIEEASSAMQEEIPAKRFAEPVELANAILFLASECAAYINGVNLPVDGGRTSSL